MTAVRQMLGDYLALRRGLGYKLLSAGTALQSFVGFWKNLGPNIFPRSTPSRGRFCQPRFKQCDGGDG